jgi:thioredoxin reductase (NADPH)
MAEGVTLYAVAWCRECHRVRTLLEAAGVAYREVDPEDPAVAQELAAGTGGTLDVPVVRVGERVFVNPDDETLARALGISVPPDLDVYDVAIVGGGPAGLTAAIYTARERLRTLILEKGMPGGQAAATGRIENYPGFPDPVGGMELMERVQRQAERFGAQIRSFEEVASLAGEGELFRLAGASGQARSRSVILATGSVYRRLGVPGETALIGRGVSFCATCDAPFFRGKHVVVVGGGNSALQEAIHLAGFVDRITLVQVLDHLTASRVLEERIRALPRLDLLLSHEILRVVGDTEVRGVLVRHLATWEERELACDGVFVFIGLMPNTGFLRGTLPLDPAGFLLADPVTLATSLPGVFAAGDVRAGSSKQITAAVGEGTVAAFMVQKWLEGRRRRDA